MSQNVKGIHPELSFSPVKNVMRCFAKNELIQKALYLGE